MDWALQEAHRIARRIAPGCSQLKPDRKDYDVIAEALRKADMSGYNRGFDNGAEGLDG